MERYLLTNYKYNAPRFETTRSRFIVGLVILLTILSLIGLNPGGQTPYLQVQAMAQEEEGPAPSPPQDGTVECHNFTKNGKKPNCICWGQPNLDNPQNPNCKPPDGEDPKCTNHCKRHMCKCKTKCQS